jgi:hypothetical protein
MSGGLMSFGWEGDARPLSFYASRLFATID